jgi:hypothetical protein
MSDLEDERQLGHGDTTDTFSRNGQGARESGLDSRREKAVEDEDEDTHQEDDDEDEDGDDDDDDEDEEADPGRKGRKRSKVGCLSHLS